MTGVPAEWYVLTRFVVDEATIAGDDPQAIIDPVWYTTYKVERDFFGRLLDCIRSQPEAFYFGGEVHAPPPPSKRRFN